MLDDFPSLRAQRESFRVAAERALEGHPAPRRARRRRWARRGAAAIGVAALGVGGVAVATELIAVGEPQQETFGRPPDTLPASRYRIVLVARDTPLPWAVGVFRSVGGEPCAIGGQLRGGRLGLVRDGTFRPFAPDSGGPCRKSAARLVFSTRAAGNRLTVFGFAPTGTATVEVVERDGTRRRGAAARGGEFLFVYDGSTAAEDLVEVIPRDADGRRIR